MNIEASKCQKYRCTEHSPSSSFFWSQLLKNKVATSLGSEFEEQVNNPYNVFWDQQSSHNDNTKRRRTTVPDKRSSDTCIEIKILGWVGRRWSPRGKEMVDNWYSLWRLRLFCLEQTNTSLRPQEKNHIYLIRHPRLLSNLWKSPMFRVSDTPSKGDQVPYRMSDSVDGGRFHVLRSFSLLCVQNDAAELLRFFYPHHPGSW